MPILFCDSNCELWFDKAKELHIDNIIQMPYTICNKEYFYDNGKTYDAKKFFGLVRDGNMPITSGLNSENYKEYFEPHFKKGEEILYVSFSEKLSGTFKYLEPAVKELSEKYPEAKFVRFDSKGISMAAGLAVFAAAKLVNEGKSLEEIISFLEGFIQKINATFTPDSLLHLKRGGRLSAAQAILGSILQVKPIIKLTSEGALANTEKVNGRMKALNLLADDAIENARDLDKYPIIVLDGDCESDSKIIAQKIREALPQAEIWEQKIGPVIGTHCGPGTLGVCYVGESRPK